MLIKLLTKLVLSGGAMAGTVFVIKPAIMDEKEIKKTEKKEEVKIKQEQIKTLEDIDIYGKQNGCFFGFVNDWKANKINKAEEFVNEATKSTNNVKSREVWTQSMIDAVKREIGKEKCKDNRVLAFFNGTTGFHLTGPKQT